VLIKEGRRLTCIVLKEVKAELFREDLRMNCTFERRKNAELHCLGRRK
jgi:hypothetical protein